MNAPNYRKDTFNKWGRENLKTFSLRLSRNKDNELIKFLEEKKPVNAYLKSLVIADMEIQKD